MLIHVVQAGETLSYISGRYNIPMERLILENGITNPNNLVVGQTVVIVYPLITHEVEEGETLGDIAIKYDVSLMQILRNNPYLSNRNILYPGESIVISYDTNIIRSIVTNGYAYPYINKDTLFQTLPFLTYLTILNYRVTMDGDILDNDDTDIIKTAKEYGVAPMMFLAPLSEVGIGNREISEDIYKKPVLQEKIINSTLNILKTKGYYGVDIYLQQLTPENLPLINEYVIHFSQRLKAEGYRVVVSITPIINIEETVINYQLEDYSAIARQVDSVQFITYDWSYNYTPPSSVTPYNIVNNVFNIITSTVPSEKILFGFPVIGYDWMLPYIPGYTVARSITHDEAIELAAFSGSEIEFDDISKAPYYYYLNEEEELHMVWFKDSRSIEALSGLVLTFNLQGLSIWNIMRFFEQMWFIFNTMYEFEKVDVNRTYHQTD